MTTDPRPAAPLTDDEIDELRRLVKNKNAGDIIARLLATLDAARQPDSGDLLVPLLRGVAPHTITPDCGPICWTTGHHHDPLACDGCRRLADMMHAAGAALAAEPPAAPPADPEYRGEARWAFLNPETGDWIEVKPGTVHVAATCSREATPAIDQIAATARAYINPRSGGTDPYWIGLFRAALDAEPREGGAG